MKTKLAETNAEIVQQASEHLKKRQQIEAELEQSKERSSMGIVISFKLLTTIPNESV